MANPAHFLLWKKDDMRDKFEKREKGEYGRGVIHGLDLGGCFWLGSL